MSLCQKISIYREIIINYIKLIKICIFYKNIIEYEYYYNYKKMKEINIDKNHLIIFLLFALLVVLICVLIVLLYKTFCNKKNKENKIFISEGDDENENEEAINQNPAAETSRAILHTLENANLANHHGNLSSRYHSLSNQIANAFNKNER